MKKRLKLSYSLTISLALVTWVIFYPGILSVDSLYTFREASLGSFTDIRSPFITTVLSLFLKAGGTIGLLTLLQCLLGFLGVRRLILAITALFSVERARQKWIACFVILLLSSPLTPMPVYFATFWLDTWLAIFLLWVVALLLELAKEISMVITRESQMKISLLITLITFAMLTRLNSPILYPALILGLSSVLWHKPISHRWLLVLALCPLVFYLLFTLFQYKVMGVKRVHQERNVLALDLASMLTYNPSICQTLSLQSCDVIQGKLSPGFIAGNGAIDHTLNQGLGTIEPAFVDLASSPLLPHDLWLAIYHYPWTYGAVKVLNFLDYIRPRDQYYFQAFIHPNNLGFSFNPRFEPVRNKLFVLLHVVYQHPVLKIFSFVHLPWILVNFTGIAFYFIYKRISNQFKTLGTILFIPAIYYFSYLIALTASDFRFMYPSTLLMQVLTFTLLVQIIALPAIAGRWRDNPLLQSIETIRRG